MKGDYRAEFLVHFAVGALITWPFAILVGRRMKTYAGTGVPRVPMPYYRVGFPDVEPAGLAARQFRKYFYGTLFVGSFVYARYMTDHTQM